MAGKAVEVKRAEKAFLEKLKSRQSKVGKISILQRKETEAKGRFSLAAVPQG